MKENKLRSHRVGRKHSLNATETKQQAMLDISEDCVYGTTYDKNYVYIEYHVMTALHFFNPEIQRL